MRIVSWHMTIEQRLARIEAALGLADATSESDFSAVVGQWPGDETDAQIDAALGVCDGNIHVMPNLSMRRKKGKA